MTTAPATAASRGASPATIIEQARLVAIIRADTSAEIVAATRALAAAGAPVAEISLAAPSAITGLEQSAHELGDQMVLGAGTVRTVQDAERALAAGAQFLVSPNLDHGVRTLAQRREVLHLPGIFSPTELGDALASGANLIKLFPAARLGSGYLRDLLAPFPEARLVATGGINTQNALEFLDAGAVAVAVGSALVGAATINDPNTIRSRLDQFQSLIKKHVQEESCHGD